MKMKSKTLLIIKTIKEFIKEEPNKVEDKEIWTKRVMKFLDIEYPSSKAIKSTLDFILLSVFDSNEMPRFSKKGTIQALKNILQDLIKKIELDSLNIFNIDLHPKVKEVSLNLFENGHYSEAIFECVKSLNIFVKEKANIDNKDLTNAMSHIFGENNPIIKINNLSNQSEIDEQKGFKFLYMGAMTGIRNFKAHELGDIKDPNIALEYLAFLSLLFRRADQGTL